MRTGRCWTAGAALAIVVAGAVGCDVDAGLSDGGDRPRPGGSAGELRPGGQRIARAREDLGGLRTAAERGGTGYRRDRFGQRWKDIDRNGCDQRNDVLARDLEKVVRRGSCVVVAGLLRDPYSGREISFTKAAAAEVQIDHLYPLALAWRMGADRWTGDRRERFANDQANLLAVWGVPNQQKSDSGPGEWRPRREFQCGYAVRYVAVAHAYRLPVTPADRTALTGFLRRC